ncbi:MAG: Mrp/NBP35 family ATP-binding protein, partial [Burkholderiaceae bacterium]
MAHTHEPIPGVKAVVAIASGKGGVGKSTTTINLALALLKMGLKVGVADADIYGPSLPTLLDLHDKPEITEDKRMLPLRKLGLQVNSIGFLVPPEQAVAWRGPMASGALQQIVKQTAWDALDVLLIDMPPGTGDVHLTLAQQIPLQGAVIVTTPQRMALADALKGLRMFERVSVPVLGVVENMAVFACPCCKGVSHLFGQGGGQQLADQTGVPLLGSLPLVASIMEQSDKGVPTVAAYPESPEAKLYAEIAERLWSDLTARLEKSAKRPTT